MGKRLCWSLFLIKLLALRPATLLKRDCNTNVCFPANVEKFLRTDILKNTCESLLLNLRDVSRTLSNTYDGGFCEKKYITNIW